MSKQTATISVLSGIVVALIGLATAIVQSPALGNTVIQYLLPGNKDVGVKAVFKQSNDFISSEKGKIRDQIENSKEEVWMFGTTFYLTIPTFEDIILRKLEECKKFTFIVLNPDADNYEDIAKSMGYTKDRLNSIVSEGISALATLKHKRSKGRICSNLDIFLTNIPFYTRIYMFDPQNTEGSTYFVPQIYGKDSTKLPGFLLVNSAGKHHTDYFESIRDIAHHPKTVNFDVWIKSNPQFQIR